MPHVGLRLAWDWGFLITALRLLNSSSPNGRVGAVIVVPGLHVVKAVVGRPGPGRHAASPVPALTRMLVGGAVPRAARHRLGRANPPRMTWMDGRVPRRRSGVFLPAASRSAPVSRRRRSPPSFVPVAAVLRSLRGSPVIDAHLAELPPDSALQGLKLFQLKGLLRLLDAGHFPAAQAPGSRHGARRGRLLVIVVKPVGLDGLRHLVKALVPAVPAAVLPVDALQAHAVVPEDHLLPATTPFLPCGGLKVDQRRVARQLLFLP
mmetsp:Transcript_26688/g.63242  ORF Transcript_26688/g.63242 Transcript_26688/m.63242 type:complete len:263 (+) Transcript_26688:2625-3413(+)